jgi:hypothetical protein
MKHRTIHYSRETWRSKNVGDAEFRVIVVELKDLAARPPG